MCYAFECIYFFFRKLAENVSAAHLTIRTACRVHRNGSDTANSYLLHATHWHCEIRMHRYKRTHDVSSRRCRSRGRRPETIGSCSAHFRRAACDQNPCIRSIDVYTRAFPRGETDITGPRPRPRSDPSTSRPRACVYRIRFSRARRRLPRG